MIRVLIVDDSATSRQFLAEILRADPEITIVGEARNGVEAVALTQKLRPDIVTMDVHMPRMDGFTATKEIMITAPTPIIIVTASWKSRETELSLNALRAGALTVVRRPPGLTSEQYEEIAQQFIATIKSMAQVRLVRHWRDGKPAQPPLRESTQEARKPSIVAIATSTGGPAALHRLLSDLPGDFSVPILVVQHISSGFTQEMARWLNSASKVRVKVAEDGETLASHQVYLAPDDRHIGVRDRTRILVSADPPVRGFRPSGTFLFESVSLSFGSSAIAIIMTGMGEDGVAGLEAVRQAGGYIIAQDEKTSVIFGMPGTAIAAGLADAVLPLEAIAGRLGELVRSP